MRDLFFVGFMLLFFVLAFKRPYFATLGYVWIDMLQPQEQSYYLINTVPVSFVAALAALAAWVLGERDKQFSFGAVQALLVLILIWVTITTFNAVLPEQAWVRHDSVWKVLAFALFLPLVLRTRIQIEAMLFVLACVVAALTMSGGVKTALGGGGYGNLDILTSRNSGLYESSTLSAVAAAFVPLVLYLYKHNTLFKRSWLTRAAALGMIAVGVLTVFGAEARTGLLCYGALAGLLFLKARRKMLWVITGIAVALVALPFVPTTFSERMGTIKTYDEDTSASTRLAMWGWTLNLAAEKPLGGGFGVWRTSQIKVQTSTRKGEGNATDTTTRTTTDQARGFHSSFFEVLGEHGWLGLGLFLGLFAVTLTKLRKLTKRFKDDPEHLWIADLARALGYFIVVYLVGSAFQALAWQSTVYHIIAISVALCAYATRLERAAAVQAPVRPALRPLDHRAGATLARR